LTYLLARDHPQKYVRMASDVMSPEGQMRFPGGGLTVRRPEDSLLDDAATVPPSSACCSPPS